MPLTALGILLGAAVLHAGWNLILKQSERKFIALWWGSLIVAILCLPILILHPAFPARVWPFALGSALFEAAYEGTLAAAYQKEDFSLVYPIARGSAPALLLVWSMLFLKETPTPLGIAGLVVLTLGLMILGSSRWWEVRGHGIQQLSGIALAGLVALFISIYSAIDGAAVKLVDAVPYTILIFNLTSLLAAPVILKLYGWRAMRDEMREHGLRAVSIGGLSLGSYMLVLIVYTFAPVSYAGAIREVSIVFGALAGWLWLKERFGATRAAGAAVIFAGIMAIVLAG
ncbi:MAG TPA: EamA family transporter [Anaerolineaceae bacterium]